MAIRISLIFGTRPEAIKLCPLAIELQRNPCFDLNICVTAQHREMLDQVLDVFEIVPDVDLDLMRPDQALAGLTARAVTAIDEYLSKYQPNMVIVQGDTTTTFCAALAAYYGRICIGHVEAGLRTREKFSPFPEEINRVMTSRLADLHFAPTQRAKENLLNEGIREDRILVTGNTVIDALHIAVEKVRQNPPAIPNLPAELFNGHNQKPLVLITGHRRENFGDGFESICRAISQLSRMFQDTVFVYPVHLNPNVRRPMFDILSGHRNIYLIEPLAYLPFIALMDRCWIVLTDSGGIQEETPSLCKPALVMRDTTERPEAVELGAAKLVGTECDSIVDNVASLLTDPERYRKMACAVNPYGDGKAVRRIADAILTYFA